MEPPTCGIFAADPNELPGKEAQLLRLLAREYTPELAKEVLLPLLTQQSPVSLRALDWTVVNWAKQHNVVCASRVPGRMTNVHHAYRTSLAYWRRRLFDPFRRRARMGVWIQGQLYETTLGQANFAMFAYRTGILAYVYSHIKAIEADMNSVARRQKRARKDATHCGKRRKRAELTTACAASCVAYAAPRRVHITPKKPTAPV